MKFRPIEKWKDPESDCGLLFFVQRMEELTFAYTIDSYRPPTMCPPQLALECLGELKSAQNRGKTLTSQMHLIEEFETRLRTNIVVKELLGIRLDNYLNYDHSSFEDTNKNLRVLSREISPHSYSLKCFELIEKTCCTNRKSEIDFLARETVSSLNNLGVSSEFINQTIISHFYKGDTITGTASLKPFFRQIFPHNHNFSVLFIIDTPAEAVSPNVFKKFGLKMLDSVPEEFKGKFGSRRIRKLRKNESYLVVEKVESTDKFSAVNLAKDSIERLHDLFGIYHHKGSFWLDDSAHTLQACCNEELSAVQVHINRMQFTIDKTPTDAATKVEELIDALRLPSGPDRAKFFRVMSFHGSSSQSHSVETQLVNIWTSLETMAPIRTNTPIVSSVIKGVLPFIGLNYFRRLFLTLMFDLVRWNRRILSKALKASNINEHNDVVEKVFSLVCLKENEDALSQVMSDLGNFELLRYRTYSLNRAFASPKKAFELLSNHQRRVEWQLHRIYRTRNAIIHTGRKPRNATSLFTNAHDYFDQVFDISCALCSGPSGYNNYEDAFSFIDMLFQQYCNDLSKMKSFDTDSSSKLLWNPPKSPNTERWLKD